MQNVVRNFNFKIWKRISIPIPYVTSESFIRSNCWPDHKFWIRRNLRFLKIIVWWSNLRPSYGECFPLIRIPLPKSSFQIVHLKMSIRFQTRLHSTNARQAEVPEGAAQFQLLKIFLKWVFEILKSSKNVYFCKLQKAQKKTWV